MLSKELSSLLDGEKILSFKKATDLKIKIQFILCNNLLEVLCVTQ